jgi:hypothetical protein
MSLLTLLRPSGAAPTATKVWVKVSNAWKEATAYTKVSGTWKVATPKTKVSGTWK